MDDALAAAGAPLAASWVPPPVKRKAKKHKKKAGKKRRRDDVDGSCIAARALASGFVRMSGLLPPEAAAAAADLVRQAPEEAWRRSSAKSDAKAHGKKTNTTRHSYAVGDVEALIQSVLESVAPSEWLRVRRLVPRLQLGRYGRGDHIVKHDDAAVVDIDGVPHERRIALVYYLTGEPTWDASLGGLFVDHASGRRFAPVHNTLVAFRVPRLHEVSRVIGDRSRYSIFGWLYAPRGSSR
jgi:predicted 2-oxoglutarate/Fe(II)-dependent dioxygenase YbiX